MSILHDILKKNWGFEEFRPLQEEIITASVSGKDVLALLPTGSGKSICYQVSGLAIGKLTLVVSPLIALMTDQVGALKKKGVKAECIHSGMSYKEVQQILDDCTKNVYDFLYVSPERLKTASFRERLQYINVGLLAIDEAHCISEWGYDFRPAYLEIAEVRKELEGVPVLALTATATPDVVVDIQDKLLFREGSESIGGSFQRKNISYSCFNTEEKEKKLFNVLTKVEGSSIVYVRSRNATQDLARKLRARGISADFYHAGLNFSQRKIKQADWMEGKTRVIIATNAFGMGIDKPDVRSIIHMDLPQTMEAYYQETGRAGRDGNYSYAVLLFNDRDVELLKERFENQYPEYEFIKRVYQALANYYKIAVGSSNISSFDFDFNDFCTTYKLERSEAYHAVNRLEKEGLIQLSEPVKDSSKLMFMIEGKEVYEFEISNKKFEPLIKLMLRMYGGVLYSHFSPISEVEISKHLKCTIGDVTSKLTELKNLGIVEYEQKKTTTQIFFVTPRVDVSKLQFNIREIEERKKHEQHVMQKIIDYAYNTDICRVEFVLSYFGEELKKGCGICDICLKKTREKKQENDIEKEILSSLDKTTLRLKDLVDGYKELDKEKVLSTIKEMLDRGLIIYNEDEELTLNR